MTNNTNDALSRWFWNIIYTGVKFQYIILAVILGVTSYFLLQYWQTLTRAPFQNDFAIQANEMVIHVWIPDKVFVGDDESKIDITIESPEGIKYTEPIDVEIICPKNAICGKLDQIVPNSSGKYDYQSITFGYREVEEVETQIDIKAIFYIDKKPFSTNGFTKIDDKSQPTIILITSLLTAAIALLNLANQIKNLIKKN